MTTIQRAPKHVVVMMTHSPHSPCIPKDGEEEGVKSLLKKNLSNLSCNTRSQCKDGSGEGIGRPSASLRRGEDGGRDRTNHNLSGDGAGSSSIAASTTLIASSSPSISSSAPCAKDSSGKVLHQQVIDLKKQIYERWEKSLLKRGMVFEASSSHQQPKPLLSSQHYRPRGGHSDQSGVSSSLSSSSSSSSYSSLSVSSSPSSPVRALHGITPTKERGLLTGPSSASFPSMKHAANTGTVSAELKKSKSEGKDTSLEPLAAEAVQSIYETSVRSRHSPPRSRDTGGNTVPVPSSPSSTANRPEVFSYNTVAIGMRGESLTESKEEGERGGKESDYDAKEADEVDDTVSRENERNYDEEKEEKDGVDDDDNNDGRSEESSRAKRREIGNEGTPISIHGNQSEHLPKEDRGDREAIRTSLMDKEKELAEKCTAGSAQRHKPPPTIERRHPPLVRHDIKELRGARTSMYGIRSDNGSGSGSDNDKVSSLSNGSVTTNVSANRIPPPLPLYDKKDRRHPGHHHNRGGFLGQSGGYPLGGHSQFGRAHGGGRGGPNAVPIEEERFIYVPPKTGIAIPMITPPPDHIKQVPPNEALGLVNERLIPEMLLHDATRLANPDGVMNKVVYDSIEKNPAGPAPASAGHHGSATIHHTGAQSSGDAHSGSTAAAAAAAAAGGESGQGKNRQGEGEGGEERVGGGRRERSGASGGSICDLPPYYHTRDPQDETLEFESRFESGNLRRAIMVYPYEYDLILKPDVNTRGHTQW